MHGKAVAATVAVVGVLLAFALSIPSLSALGTSSLQGVPEQTRDVQPSDYNIVERYKLPAFNRDAGDSNEQIASAQVMVKAQRVGFTSIYPSDPTSAMNGLASDIQNHQRLATIWHDEVEFTGTTAAELQQLINNSSGKLIRIMTPDLRLDESITLPADTHIEGNGARIWCNLVDALFIVDGQHEVSLTNLDISGNAEIGIFAHDATNVIVQDCHIHDLSGKAVVVSGASRYFHILNNEFRQNKKGGITIAGGSSYGQLLDNTVSYNTGYSNWMAGIVLTNVDAVRADALWDAFPGAVPHSAERTTLADVPASVHDVLVQGNTVEHNQSSGIYCDGIYRCYVVENTIKTNDKEGMCLDYGTIGCFVHANTVADNGRRALQSDEALELDGMLDFGRMPDGSACAKLPGISLDNAAYNTIEANTIKDNWGGGVKNVHCAIRNVIVGNEIDNNNRGQNDVFFFIGVELGYADEGAQSPSMDYIADYQNIVMNNQITGPHYTGVFIAHGCEGNTISHNTIKGQTHFAFMNGSNLKNDLSSNDYTGRFIDRSIVPFL